MRRVSREKPGVGLDVMLPGPALGGTVPSLSVIDGNMPQAVVVATGVTGQCRDPQGTHLRDDRIGQPNPAGGFRTQGPVSMGGKDRAVVHVEMGHVGRAVDCYALETLVDHAVGDFRVRRVPGGHRIGKPAVQPATRDGDVIALQQPDRVVVSVEIPAGNVNPTTRDHRMADPDEIHSRRTVVAIGRVTDFQSGQHDVRCGW